MRIYDIYVLWEKEVDALALKDCKQYEAEEKKLVAFRNNKFTKEDWLQLIKDAGSGRARYEYTRMMNERFPETKDEK